MRVIEGMLETFLTSILTPSIDRDAATAVASIDGDSTTHL